MNDASCIGFLQWALPRMGLRWSGYRKVRQRVCRRLRRRLVELGLADLGAYQRYLLEQEEEWGRLREICRIVISRFFRDQGLFDTLATTVLPELAASVKTCHTSTLRCWSIGCASGEEPYSLALLWQLHGALAGLRGSMKLEILGTDIDPALLDRARRGCYPGSSLRELPRAWKRAGFTRRGDLFCLKEQFQSSVGFAIHDILRDQLPPTPFHLVFCRNLAFTYFDAAGQLLVQEKLARALVKGGILALGSHEGLQADGNFVPWQEPLRIFRRC